jgi:MFS family permease
LDHNERWFQLRAAFVVLAVAWGANQWVPMLIVYRHALGLPATGVAGLFAVYAAALVPGLLIGGPASDRYGRRPVVLPFAVASPVATLLVVLAPRDLAVITVSRALAGVCSGVVFAAATPWAGPRLAALALTAGFGLSPVAAALLAQRAADPLRTPYLPHLLIGTVAAVVVFGARVPASGARGPAAGTGVSGSARGWPPKVVRTARFWLTVAPAAPVVLGSVSVAIVVLPADVTSARTLSAGFAGLMAALAFSAGAAVQPLARRLEPGSGTIAGLLCAAAGTGTAIAAVPSMDRRYAALAAVFLGLGYGLCLTAGLRQAERLAGPGERGAVVACFYVLAYVGFGAPYLVAGLGALAGKTAPFVIFTITALLLAATQAATWPSRDTLKAWRHTCSFPVAEVAPRLARTRTAGQP